MNGVSRKLPIVKRQYSRSGCKECKRRKIKCDETHPACGNCVRVNMICVFPLPNSRNKPRQRRIKPPPETPRDVGQDQAMALGNFPSLQPSTAAFPGSPLTTNLDMLLFENVFDDANLLVHGLADFESSMLGPGLSSTSSSSPDRLADLKPFHSQIILNNSENAKNNVFFDDDELELYLQNTNVDTNPMLAQLWNAFSSHMNASELHGPNQQALIADLVKTVIETYNLSPEEQEYLTDFAMGGTAYYFFPFISNTSNNQVMRVILEYLMVLKFMVYAMMALSGLCLYTITKEKVHETCHKKYTRICMRLLVRAFTDLTNNESLLWHIEGLILTVLILTMLFSEMNCSDKSLRPELWVAHLNNARLLLIKYMNLKEQSSMHRPDSLGIVLAKLMFFFYDWYTNMCLPVHLINSEHLAEAWAITGKLDAMVEDPEHIAALTKLGLMIPASKFNSAFNTFTALTPEVMKIIYEVLATISRLNMAFSEGKPRQASPETITNIMSLINQALKQNVVPGVSSANSYIILLDNAAHPQHTDILSRIILPDCAYGIDTDSVLKTHYLWFDVVVKLHVYFLYLKILTSHGLLQLPRGHPLIVALIEEIMAMMFFLKPKLSSVKPDQVLLSSENFYLPKCLYDHRVLLIQFPFRLCLELTDLEEDFEKLLLFFEGLVRLGCGSCIPVVEKAKKNRDLSKKRVHDKQKQMDIQGVDYLTQIFDIY